MLIKIMTLIINDQNYSRSRPDNYSNYINSYNKNNNNNSNNNEDGKVDPQL